jgi:hypothetical protein
MRILFVCNLLERVARGLAAVACAATFGRHLEAAERAHTHRPGPRLGRLRRRRQVAGADRRAHPLDLDTRLERAHDPRSVMQNVRVEFAGGTSTTGSNSCPYPGSNGSNDAAIRIFGPPLTQFITGTEILSSLHDGIDRDWRADLQPDFLAGNFTAVAACKQTVPRTAAGVCPLVLPCP